MMNLDKTRNKLPLVGERYWLRTPTKGKEHKKSSAENFSGAFRSVL